MKAVKKCKEKSNRIDLGLALLAHAAKPGVSLTFADIAAWCDCSPHAIAAIETKALKKLRGALVLERKF